MLLARLIRLSPLNPCRTSSTVIGSGTGRNCVCIPVRALVSPAATRVRDARSTMSGGTGIVWFKPTDLRLDDHEPLLLAHQAHEQVLHVFVFDDDAKTSGLYSDSLHRASASPVRAEPVLRAAPRVTARGRWFTLPTHLRKDGPGWLYSGVA